MIQARENARNQVITFSAFELVGGEKSWEGGPNFLDQSQSEAKQNQYSSGLLSTMKWKLYKTHLVQEHCPQEGLWHSSAISMY